MSDPAHPLFDCTRLVREPTQILYARMDRLERTLHDAQRAGFTVKRGRAQYGPGLLPKRVEQVVAVNPDLDELRRLSRQRR